MAEIFDNVNILVGIAHCELMQIYGRFMSNSLGYTPKLLNTLAKFGEGYDEASDLVKNLFASFWQNNQRRWGVIQHHFTADEQQAIRGLANPFHYFT